MKKNKPKNKLQDKLINPDNVELIYRREGAIKPLMRKTMPKRMILFDTETFIKPDETGKNIFPFRLGVAIYIEFDDSCNIKDREVCRFKDIKVFLDFILDKLHKRTTLYLLAHNFGFDGIVLDIPYRFDALGFTSDPPIINDRVFIWDLKSDKGNITVLDTANFGVISVAQLGKDMAFPKMTVDFNNVTDEYLFEYCQNDVMILETFMVEYIQFIHKNDLGLFRSTLASQALTAWRTSFMQHPVYIHNHEPSILLEREAYHGGRVECFYIGTQEDKSFYKLDVNSMYPYVMKFKKLPCELEGYIVRPSVSKLKAYMKEYYVIARVTLNTNNNAYPFITTRDMPIIDDTGVYSLVSGIQRSKGKLIFPIGTFETVLHHCELEYALEQGDIVDVIEMTIYRSELVFENYIDFFYEQKLKATLEGNKSWRYLSKIFLVSLYGKFGQQGVKRELQKAIPENEINRFTIGDRDDGTRLQVLEWFGSMYYEYRGGESYYSMPAIAGAITAEARFLLYIYYKQCGLNNCLYCDTDSLIVNFEGFYNLSGLVDNDLLGSLKLEDYATSVDIFNSKDYRFGEEIHIKGINKNAVQLGKSSWECLQFMSFNAWLSSGGQLEAQAKKIIKERKTLYDKGIVCADLNSNSYSGNVIPIKLNYDI